MKKMMVYGFIILIAYMVISNPFTNEYISVKQESVSVLNQKDSLYNEIEMKADQYNIPSIDAKIDPIWKAIPGYNGLAVNIEDSYNKMKKTGQFNEKLLVFQQVKPSIHLDDLPPAPIYKGNPDKPMVSFIINVAWGNEYLSEMLATLKKHHVSATFFLEGRWAQKYPELAKMIKDAGHEVGNHSFTHPDMKQLSTRQIQQEITKTNGVIKATTGSNPKWFGPPSGSFRDEVVQIASNEEMGTILWSVDTIDWQKPSSDVLIHRVMSKVHNGAIILMHPTAATSQSLEQLILQIKNKRMQIDTISNLLNEERIIDSPPQISNDNTQDD
jgi:peptidoglycan-N-acetylglucosamine deacetylase